MRRGVLPDGRELWQGTPERLIPEWNEFVYRGRWNEAAERLSLTSPMPEFTSRVCPALCEAACNLGSVDGQPTTIHDNERAISDHEWANGGPRRFEPAVKFELCIIIFDGFFGNSSPFG